jgi:acyl-CoA synthetase (NDP forming)
MKARHPLESLFTPGSIAVRGATDRAESVDRVVLQNRRSGGYARKALRGQRQALDRARAALLREHAGARTRRRSGDIAVPAASVADVLEDCGQLGVRNAVVISAGGVGEVLDFLVVDCETHAILYLEGVDHARRLISGMRVAARMKPVVVLKSARHQDRSAAMLQTQTARAASSRLQ